MMYYHNFEAEPHFEIVGFQVHCNFEFGTFHFLLGFMQVRFFCFLVFFVSIPTSGNHVCADSSNTTSLA